MKYLVSESPDGTTSDVDLDGTVDSTGQLVWDWGTSYATDGVIQIEAAPLSGQVVRGVVPRRDVRDAVRRGRHARGGLPRRTPTAIWLHGLASTEENPAEREDALRLHGSRSQVTEFPLSVGLELDGRRGPS